MTIASCEGVVVGVHPTLKQGHVVTRDRDLAHEGCHPPGGTAPALPPCWLSATLLGGACQDQSSSWLPRGQAPADLSQKEKPGRWGVGAMHVLESPGSNQDLDPPREGPEKQEVSGCLGAGGPLF